MHNWLDQIGLLKENYKNEKIPVFGGLIILVFSILGWILFLITDTGKPVIIERLIFLSLIIGLTGLLDDIKGGTEIKGFSGHFIALINRNLTTGALKAIISLLTVLIIYYFPGQNLLAFLLNISIFLFFTNLFNLLDLRPCRSIKCFFLFSIIIMVLIPVFTLYLVPVFLILIPYSYYELGGKIMLGDNGANTLGAIMGYGFSLWTSTGGKILLLLFIIIVNFLAEIYSFTNYISKNRILNWIDQLGRY